MFPRFYPIVPDVAWVQRMAGLGVALIQLRMKEVPDHEVLPAIRQALALCNASGVTLVVNDYWQAAITAGASYLHLGQSDLAASDVAAIRRADIKLGISTHSLEELDIALKYEPDYVALGPIYETTLKAMPYGPQGLPRIAEWKAITKLPLVAIGGITLERAPGVYAAGADCIAVVSDVILNNNPDQRVREWLSL